MASDSHRQGVARPHRVGGIADTGSGASPTGFDAQGGASFHVQRSLSRASALALSYESDDGDSDDDRVR